MHLQIHHLIRRSNLGPDALDCLIIFCDFCHHTEPHNIQMREQPIILRNAVSDGRRHYCNPELASSTVTTKLLKETWLKATKAGQADLQNGIQILRTSYGPGPGGCAHPKPAVGPLRHVYDASQGDEIPPNQ